MPVEAGPLRVQSPSMKPIYFGSFFDATVTIDVKPGDNVQFNVRSNGKELIVVTTKKGAAHAQKSLATIGRVTNCRYETMLLSAMRFGTVRAIIKEENEIARPEPRQVNKPGPGGSSETASSPAEDIDAYIKARPGDKISKPFETTVTVQIYCPVGVGLQMAGILLKRKACPSCTMSPAIAHYMARAVERDKAERAKKHSPQEGSLSMEPEAIANAPFVIQRAVRSLQDEVSLPETAAPPHVTVELLPHQKRGLTFMKEKETGSLRHDVSIQQVRDGYGEPCFQDVLSGTITSTPPTRQCGGIISDAMGLGKTLLVIAYIILRRAEADAWAESTPEPCEPSRTVATLVVVPASLLDNWQLELSRRTSLTPEEFYTYHGDKRQAPDLTTKKQIIVLTSLDLLRRASNRDTDLFFNTSWYRVVYDEAHNLKSRKSRRFQNANKLRSQYTWAVTGTPTMNSVKEIQALFQLCRTPNLNTQDSFYQNLLWPIQSNAVDCADRIAIIIRTNVLRRTPDATTFHTRKTYVVARVSLSQAERALYDDAREKANEKLQNDKSVSCALSRFHGMRKICSLGATYRFADKDTPAHITQFKALRDGGATCEVCGNIPSAESAEAGLVCHITPCDHIICARCFSQDTTECPLCEGEQGHAPGPAQAVSLSELDISDNSLPTPTDDNMSEKMRFTLREVEAYRTEKIVILASYVDTVKTLSRILQGRGIQHVTVHGDIPQRTRVTEIKRFKDINSDCRVLIATIGTMGEGQNLAAASRLISLDTEWNPKKMKQAYARVERIDQTQDVTITQVVTADTVDEKILSISDKRNKFADALLTQWIRPEDDANAELEDIKTWCKA